MSKSLKRVTTALHAAGLDIIPLEMAAETRTAQQAAEAAGCALDQIAKSIIFQGMDSGRVSLFLTAGGNRVDVTSLTKPGAEPHDLELTPSDVGTVQDADVLGLIGPVHVDEHRPERRVAWKLREAFRGNRICQF